MLRGYLSPRHGASGDADGGYGLQVWTAAAKILNKEWRTADKRLSSSMGVGRRANKLVTLEINLLTK
jgi:hypothetical protein